MKVVPIPLLSTTATIWCTSFPYACFAKHRTKNLRTFEFFGNVNTDRMAGPLSGATYGDVAACHFESMGLHLNPW